MDIREKIAQDLKANYYHRSPLEQADQILAFIKEAGYKSPEEITSFLSSIAEDTLKKARAGYVKLADDQSLPPVPEKHKNYPGYMSPCNDAWQDGYKWLRKQLVSWRKVELEVKDGQEH